MAPRSLRIQPLSESGNGKMVQIKATNDPAATAASLYGARR